MPINSELEKRIMTTNDAGLIAILLEKLIDNFKSCKVCIERKAYGELMDINNNSRDIFGEIIFQFSGNDEISSRIREIILYVNKLITEGEYKKDISYYDTSIKVLSPMVEGFQKLEVKDTPKAVAGITYGKGNLGEYSLKEERSFKA